MEPYYDDGVVTIYHGDARDEDGWRAGDVLVTDPPYGIAYSSNRSANGPTDPIAGDGDAGVRDEILALWGDVRAALVFGNWRIPHPPDALACLIWDKGEVGAGDLEIPWRPSFEEIYVLGDREAGWVGPRGPGVIRVPNPPRAGDRPDHPTPKPVALMRLLLEHCPEGVIVDPFAGSGSTLRAAKDLGRRAIGVEVDERYCEIAARRMGQEVLDLGAFG